MSTIETSEPAGAAAKQDFGIVDSDVHPNFEDGIRDLIPYMSQTWKQRMGFGQEGWATTFAASAFHLPLNYLHVNSAGAFRKDAAFDGKPPASDARHTARDLLDRHDIHRGVLIAGQLFGIGAMPNPEVAATIASAYNDWMTERWLEVDTRYRGALVVAPQDPELAVKEIERVAGRPGMTAIFMPLHEILWGERHYYPIYEAAQEHALPIITHPSGTESVFARSPRMAGTPTFYIEWHAGLAQIHYSNVLSLLVHGVFERYPGLKVVIAEGGFTWLAELMWKLDRDWQSLRDEIPWVKRPPSEYVLDHVWCTSQPFIEPAKKEHVKQILDMVRADRTMLFSSDYPHWDFDDPQRALAAMAPELRRQIMVDGPLEVYGDRIR